MHLDFLSSLIFASDRWWVWLALYGFSLASAYSAYSLVTGKFMAPRLTFGLISAGFISQTLFLVDRGHQIGRCPITNFFELLVFLGWSMTLIYLLIGSSYRLSLLGVITAPFVAVLNIWALLAPDHPLLTGHQPVNPWLETHTSFSIVACGAFALAGVAGLMYLFQERQLKTRKPGSIFCCGSVLSFSPSASALAFLSATRLTGERLPGRYWYGRCMAAFCSVATCTRWGQSGLPLYQLSPLVCY
jgi:hypothetical protein